MDNPSPAMEYSTPEAAASAPQRGASRGAGFPCSAAPGGPRLHPVSGIALGLLILACGLSAEQIYEVRGVVRAVNAADKQLEISHEEIPGFMPAMTMSFDVVSADLLEGLEPGTAIHFRLERRGTLLRIIEVKRSGQADGYWPELARPLAELEPAPEFTLRDHHDRPFSLSELRGSVVLLDFVFTRCSGPCPILTAAHAELQARLPEALAARTHFVSVSIDPTYDTPERLRRYARERGANLANWSFLTGEPDTVAEVLADYGVGSIRQPDGSLDHVVATFLLDPSGRIARRYLGLEHPSASILADLRALLR